MRLALATSIEAKRDYLRAENDLLNSSLFDFASEKTLLVVDDCRLIEVRKGARVSYRESTYSSNSHFGSVRVGSTRVGAGSSGGSSSSRSVSYPAPDELQEIDYGKLIVTSRKISFVGGKFTKTTDYKKLIDSVLDGYQILIAPSSGSKVWICEFPTVAHQWIVALILAAASESETRTLDADTKSNYGGAKETLRALSKLQVRELELAVEYFGGEISRLGELYSVYQDAYGAKVPSLE
jgi:hypothetical protein